MKKESVLFTLSALVICSLASCKGNNNVSASNSSATSPSVSSVSSEGVTSSSSSSNSISISSIDRINELQVALDKDYSNVTFENSSSAKGSFFDFTDNKFYEIDKDVKEITDVKSEKEYKLSYYAVDNIVKKEEEAKGEEGDPSISINQYDVFVKESDTKVNLYLNDGEGSYSNYALTKELWNKKYSSGEYKFSYAFSNVETPTDFNLNAGDFEYKDGKYVPKSDKLSEVGNKLFVIDDEVKVTFESIEITLENGYVSKIDSKFAGSSKEGDVDYVYTFKYTNVGTTNVTYPNVNEEEYPRPVAPVYTDPALGQEMTAAQKQALEKALGEEFNSYIFSYYMNSDDGYMEVSEYDLVEGTKTQTNYAKSALYGLYSTSFSYYFEITEDNEAYVYEMDEDKFVTKTQLMTEDDIYDYAPYSISPCDLGLSSMGFVSIDDNTYVLSEKYLKTTGKAISDYLYALEISLNDGHVEEIYCVVYIDDEDGEYYETYTYSYADINAVSVNIPEGNKTALRDMTVEEETRLSDALDMDFSNVSVYDSIFESEIFYVDGHLYNMYYDYEDGITYLYEIVKDGDKYYVYVDGEKGDEVSVPEFNESFISIDKDEVDFDKVKYNVFDNTYYISIEDISLEDFIPYYNVESLLTLVKGISISLDDEGNITNIYIEYVSEYEGYEEFVSNIGLEFYDYGKTQAPNVEYAD